MRNTWAGNVFEATGLRVKEHRKEGEKGSNRAWTHVRLQRRARLCVADNYKRLLDHLNGLDRLHREGSEAVTPLSRRQRQPSACERASDRPRRRRTASRSPRREGSGSCAEPALPPASSPLRRFPCPRRQSPAPVPLARAPGPSRESSRCRRSMAAAAVVASSTRALSGARGLLGAWRGFRSSAASSKSHAARIRPRKGDRPVTYEEAHPPHWIAHRKGWLSQHTANLNGENGAAERTLEDVFIRKFIFGTFHGSLANEIVLKRRANTLIISAILTQNVAPSKMYFLIGYTEVLLSFFYKCPVKMEVQTIPERLIYKYL